MGFSALRYKLGTDTPPSGAEVKECVELYLHSPICLHVVALGWAQGQSYL